MYIFSSNFQMVMFLNGFYFAIKTIKILPVDTTGRGKNVFLNKPGGQKGEKNNDSRLVSQVIITRFSNKVPNSQARFLMWQIQ